MTEGKFFIIQGVANKPRVSVRALMRYIKARKLVASKMDQWGTKESDLERFFKTNSNKYKKI